jgi:hypothetical protein
LISITCPRCGFKREVNPSTIPPTAQTATCPKCRESFLLTLKKESVGLEATRATLQNTEVIKNNIKSCLKCGCPNGAEDALCRSCGALFDSNQKGGTGCGFSAAFLLAFGWLMLVAIVSETSGDGGRRSSMTTRESIWALSPLIYVFILYAVSKIKMEK